MSKFNKTTKTTPTSPIRTSTRPSGATEQGAPGFARDRKSELFLMAVTNMVGEFTYYEKADDRDRRYADLVGEVAVTEPQWLAAFLPWLRDEANLRSASLVGALEAVHSMVAAGIPGGRRLVDAVLRRADEPGEALAYWIGRYGRAIPKPVKRGIADAVRRLYTQRSLLKYDTGSMGFRFGDVIELVHPSPDPAKPWQGDLFAHALDRRHGRDKPIPDSLPMLRARAELSTLAHDRRRELLRGRRASERLAEAGMTWEALAGWLQGPMDAAAWEAIIPSMGYMARLRNVRNLDEAGVGDRLVRQVAAELADPNAVAASRQLPMRFLSAYRAAPSLRWEKAISRALEHSLSNVPRLAGRTLILVDTSGSMNSTFSADGTLKRWDAATIFGLALAQRCRDAELVSFSNGWNDAKPSRVFGLRADEPLLKALDRWRDEGFFIGGGTDTEGAVRRHYRGHDRVVILTDEQADAHGKADVTAAVPRHRTVYTWNLAGYRRGHAPSGSRNRHTFGGLGDAAFRLIPLLEAGRDADWPWLARG